MKTHNKLTKYLVENHPLLFHSKFFQLLISGLLFWLFSFLVGYISVTKYVLLNEGVRSYYFNSMFMMFHVIACIIILSVWAIHFYKMKPLRNYYPLGKFYFTKLFFQLLIPFFLLVSAYLPFTSGAVLRAKGTLPQEEFVKDKAALSLGFSFLINNPDNYNLNQKIYPQPFPLKKGYYNKYNSEEESSYRSIFYSPSLLDKKYITRKELYKTPRLKYFLSKNDSLLKMGNSAVYFYESKLVYENSDSCKSNEIITKFINLSAQERAGITENGLLNFSISVMDSERYYYDDDFDDNFDLDGLFNYSNYDSLFIKQGVPKIHRMVNNKDFGSIKSSIEEFMEVLEKHKVGHYIEPELLIKYLKEKNFVDFEHTMVKSSLVTYLDLEEYEYIEDEESMEAVELVSEKVEVVSEQGRVVPVKKYTPLEKEILLKRLYFEKSELERLNRNYNAVYSKMDNYYDITLGLFILAFFMVSLVVWFEFTELKAFLISIPVGGVIAIVMALFVALGAMGGSGFEGIAFFTMFCLTVILVTTIFYVFNPTSKKFITSILMNLTYFVLHGYVWFGLMYLNEITTHYVDDPLSKCNDSIRSEPFGFVESPLVYLVVTILSMLLFYRLIPIWKAKKK